MKDETYLFHSEVGQKKNVARSARNRRTHAGKGGRVRLPSDNMTKKELNAMNGEVKSYRLNEPMTWVEFRAMPDDIKVTYIQMLRKKYGVPDSYLAKMFGVSGTMVRKTTERLGISNGKCQPKKWDKEGWIAWCNGVPVAKEEPEEPVPEEPIPEPVEEETEAFVIESVKDKICLVPRSGNMVFEGNVEEILNSVKNLLGNTNVSIQIFWEVKEA